MDKLKKVLIQTVLIVLTATFLHANTVSADYTSVSLYPSSGTIDKNGTTLVLKVNTGVDDYVGVDININFTGPVEYIPSSEEGISCGSLSVTKKSANVINVICFDLDHPEHDGTIVRLKFRATGSGNSTFTLTNINPPTTTGYGGIYTLTTTTPSLTPSATPKQTATKTTLPKTNLSDAAVRDIIMLVGLLSVLLVLTVNKKSLQIH